MKDITRRNLIRTGVVAATGAVGLTAAARIAERYGIIPPDHGGLYGPGETLTYAIHRLFGRHGARPSPTPLSASSPNTPSPASSRAT